MEHYLQAAALALVTVLASLALSRHNQGWTVLLSLAGCCALCMTLVQLLSPVVELLHDIRRLGNLDPEFLGILLKCAGIGILTEVVGMICADAGEATLGKALALVSNGAILWLCIPMLRKLLNLLQEVLGTL